MTRLGDCEVCGANTAKYTCPKCEVKTCCLECVKIHKKELNCDGSRNKVKFLNLKKFSNLDLQSDYILLEEVTRAVEKFSKSKLVKNPLRYQSFQPYYAAYNAKQKKQRNAAWNRGILLKFLPNHFSKHKKNYLYYDFKKDQLFLSVEWVFPQADDLQYFEKRVLDNTRLATIASKYFDEESCPDELKSKLQFYQSAGLGNVTFLLKAESFPGEKFFELDHLKSLKSNLKKKVVIEYPTIYVVLKDHKYSYEILDPEDCIGRNENKSCLLPENAENCNGITSQEESFSEDIHNNLQLENSLDTLDENSENHNSEKNSDLSRYLFILGEIDSDTSCDFKNSEELENEIEDTSFD